MMDSHRNSPTKRPTNATERKDAWKALLFKGELSEYLQQCVRRRIDGADFQAMLTDLDNWDAAQQIAIKNQNLPYILPGYDHQSKAARTLVKLAQLAARQSNLSVSQLKDEMELAPLDATSAWDAYCDFSGNARTALPGTKSKISVLLEQNQFGCLMILEIELIAEGAGRIYPAPAVNAATDFDKKMPNEKTFLEAAREVWELVRQEVVQTEEQRERLATVDVRFSLSSVRVPSYRNPQLSSVGGKSAQAAFFLCLKQSADAYLGQSEAMLFDETVAATATIDSNGWLGTVGSIPSKLEAAYLAGRAVVIVAASNETEAQQALQNAKGRYIDYPVKLEVVGIETVKGLTDFVRDRAKEREAVRRYEQEKCAKLEVIGRDDVELETHYQELPLLRQVKRDRLPRDDRERDESRRQSGEDKDDRFASLRGIELHRWEESLQQELFADKQFSLDEVLTNFRKVIEAARSDMPRFFVLGPPGSGKTTLVQYLAWRAANHKLNIRGRQLIPARVSLRLWELSCADAKRSLPEYLAERYRSETIPYLPTADHWRDWLRRGEVLLLLDGLDEINGHRQFLETLTEALIAYADCSTIITCRTVSFEQHRKLTADFPVFVLGALDTEQRDSSIKAYAKAKGGGFNADELIAQLNRAPQMHALATNPLLLSLLCFAVGEPNGAKLPTRRSELYNKTIEKLLELTQLKFRRVPIVYPDGQPDMRLIDKRRILERAALTLFAAPEQERKLTFDEASLLDALKEAARQEGYGDAPAPYVNALLEDLLHNSGLLRGNAEQGYFFLHLTFQEYLAAAAIANMVNGKGWEVQMQLSGRNVTPRQLADKKAWDPRWKDVIIFLSGQLNEPAHLLEMLAAENKDDYFRHRLSLASLCLAETHLALRLQAPCLLDQITTVTFSLWLKHKIKCTDITVAHITHAFSVLGQVNAQIKHKDVFHKDVFDKWLIPDRCKLSRCKHVSSLLDVLIELSLDSSMFREASREAICKLGPSAIPVLLTILNLKSGERLWAAQMIGKLGGSMTPVFLAYLTKQLLNSNSCEQEWAVQQTGKLGAAVAPEFSIVLTSLLESGNREEIRKLAAESLGNLGIAPPSEFLTELMVLLQNSDDAAVYRRRWAADVIGKLGAVLPSEFLGKLLALLQDPNDVRRYWAVEAISHISVAPSLQLLIALLTDPDEGVRWWALSQIRKLRTELTSDFLEALTKIVTKMLDNSDLHERSWGVRILGAMGIVAPSILLTRIALLLQDSDWLAQIEVAEAMGRFGTAAPPEFLTALMNHLHFSYSGASIYVAEAVSKIGTVSQDEFLAVLTRLMKMHNTFPRGRVARLLGGLKDVPSESLAVLMELLRDPNHDVQISALEAISQLGGSVPAEFMAKQLALLYANDRKKQQIDNMERRHAAKVICKLGAAAGLEPLSVMATLLNDSDANLRALAVEAVEQTHVRGGRFFAMKSHFFSPRKKLFSIQSVAVLSQI